MNKASVIVIGGGQSALACGYYLKRTGLDYMLLDNQSTCGGSWRHTWDSLTLFSPAKNSSLPGWPMPESESQFPSRQEVLEYLCAYEKKYELPIKRPVNVASVHQTEVGFDLMTDKGTYQAKAIVAATGNWQSPYVPALPGSSIYKGLQLHSAQYRNPQLLKGKKVLVVGGGNSGAQLYAEISEVTETVWSTLSPPVFLPDDVDGSVLFNVASAKYKAQKEGKPFNSADYNVGNIVMVPPVKAARDRGILYSKGHFRALNASGVIWDDGTEEAFDAIVWCTGFKLATDFLTPLGIIGQDHKASTIGTRANDVPGLWMVGYGNWTGYASATLIGVGRSARDTVAEIQQYIEQQTSI
nr:ArsO family NAD(P)H-dependent flavin-containing monooxygenase [uncultured Mucilaginibacter sp.]